MSSLDNDQRSYKPQTNHAGRMILPSSCTFEYVGAKKQTAYKVGFVIFLSSSFFFFLI